MSGRRKLEKRAVRSNPSFEPQARFACLRLRLYFNVVIAQTTS